MRAVRPGVPGLFITGYSEASVAFSAGGTGGPKVLPKPYAPGALLRAVRDALDGR
jgi:FixJ family two-component response regulator